MPVSGHGNIRSLKAFTDTDAAVKQIATVYETGAKRIRDRFARFVAGERAGAQTFEACYPYLGIEVPSMT